MEINLKAPAKVNFQLLVGKRRNDGYHNIDSIFATVDIFDLITVRGSKNGPTVYCPQVRDDNIAWQVLEIFSKYYNINADVEIIVEKHIPIGRGLGGGSSDAAAILLGLHRMFDLDEDQAVKLGSQVGCDVTFFFKGGVCRVTGRGEVVDPLPFSDFKIAIVSPPFPIATDWAYKLIDKYGIDDSKKVKTLVNSDIRFDNLYNSFEAIVFDQFPNLNKIKTWLLDNGATVASLTGSGSAVFGIFEDGVPRKMPFQDHELFICRTINWGVV